MKQDVTRIFLNKLYNSYAMEYTKVMALTAE